MSSEENLLTTLKDLVKPQHSAIAVIDMQNDFCHKDGFFRKGKPDSRGSRDLSLLDEMVPNLIHFLDVARSVGTKIYFVRYIGDDHYLPPMIKLRNLQVGYTKTLCAEGEWGSEQFAGFEPQPGDTVITKYVYSAFIGTNFKDILEKDGIKTLIVTGGATNVCCESTIRDGCMLGFYMVAPRDCLTCYSREDHEESLKDIGFFYGVVTTSQEIIKSWKE